MFFQLYIKSIFHYFSPQRASLESNLRKNDLNNFFILLFLPAWTFAILQLFYSHYMLLRYMANPVVHAPATIL